MGVVDSVVEEVAVIFESIDLKQLQKFLISRSFLERG